MYMYSRIVNETFTTYEPQILEKSKFFVNKWKFLENRQCADHSLVHLLHYANDVAVCLGSTISEMGVRLPASAQRRIS